MAEVLLEPNTEESEPVDVEDGHVVRQSDCHIFAVVVVQLVQTKLWVIRGYYNNYSSCIVNPPAVLIRHFDSMLMRFVSFADQEERICDSK